jgi:hypothetical protein
MISIEELNKARQEAEEKYQSAKKKLQTEDCDPSIAQSANDAWLEYKRLNNQLMNYSTLKKIGDLYGY